MAEVARIVVKVCIKCASLQIFVRIPLPKIVEARRVNWSRGHSTNARSLSDVAALREGEGDTEPNMGWKLLREGRGSEANK